MARTKVSPIRATNSKKKVSTKLYKINNKFYKINTTTINAIKKLQTSTKNCIPKLPFCRLVREVIMHYSKTGYQVSTGALVALQEAAEIYLTQLFEDGNKCAMHARRITLKPEDLRLALSIRGIQDPGYIAN